MIRVVCLLPKILSISVAHNHFLASAKTRQVYNLFQEPDDQELRFFMDTKGGACQTKCIMARWFKYNWNQTVKSRHLTYQLVHKYSLGIR